MVDPRHQEYRERISRGAYESPELVDELARRILRSGDLTVQFAQRRER